ncbi:Ankyrin repeat protein [Rutstroemia sp. NJR-2017a WRK4]|nr:Ankyrin repeat protein [Rutstroemia sp. NJR-2017a WRK4]
MVTDKKSAGENQGQMRKSRSALIKLLKSKNLKPLSIGLQKLFNLQKRLESYSSLEFSKDNEEGPQGTAKKSAPKNMIPPTDKRRFLEEFGLTKLHNEIVWAKGNVDAGSWTHLYVSDILGWTPLHYAVLYDPDIVPKIFQMERDSETKTGNDQRVLASRTDLAGRLPLHYAAIHENPKTPVLVRELLKAYGKAEAGSDGILPLHLAAKHRNEYAVKALLENRSHKDKISAGDYWGMTPLHFATNERRLKIVKLLLAKGARIDEQDKLGRTALHLAVEKNEADIVMTLLEGADGSNVTKLKDKNGETTLQLAARLAGRAENELSKLKGHFLKKTTYKRISWDRKTQRSLSSGSMRGSETARPLLSSLKLPRESETPRSLSESPLQTSESNLEEDLENLKKIIELLLSKEDLVSNGSKLLIWSAKEGFFTTFSVLIGKEVKDDETDSLNKQSILHIAALLGSEDMVDLVLNKWKRKSCSAITGSDDLKKKIDLKDNEGKTALMFAANFGYNKLPFRSSMQVLTKQQRIFTIGPHSHGPWSKTMLQFLNAMDGDPSRLLITRAAENGHLAMIKILCDKGAKTNLKAKSAQSPMYWAVKHGHADVVEYFLEAEPKPDVNEINEVPNDASLTLLAEAIRADKYDIARKLLEAGADAKKESASPTRTPMSFAATLGRKRFIKLLLEFGAEAHEVDEKGRTPLMFCEILS